MAPKLKISGVLFPSVICAEPSPAQSPVEQEVIACYDRMRDRLLRYTLSLRLSIGDAEEVVQDAFLALFEHLREGRSRANLEAWLFRVVHNFALKRLRKLRQSLESLSAQDAAAVLDPGLSPEDELCRGQEERLVEAVIRALPEQDRNCLRLRAEGMRYRDIAETLGISLGAVSQGLTRSIDRIARAAGR